MQELEKILEDIDAEFERRIGTQLKIMAGLGDDVYRYGYGKSLEAYQQGKLLVEDIIRKHMSDGWIPVEERLPKEHDSIFAKWKGTDKWSKSMFEKTSCDVNVTVEYEDGKRKTITAHTVDGKWVLPNRIIKQKVIAWRPLPEPYKPPVESEEEKSMRGREEFFKDGE